MNRVYGANIIIRYFDKLKKLLFFPNSFIQQIGMDGNGQIPFIYLVFDYIFAQLPTQNSVIGVAPK